MKTELHPLFWGKRARNKRFLFSGLSLVKKQKNISMKLLYFKMFCLSNKKLIYGPKLLRIVSGIEQKQTKEDKNK